MALTGYNPNTSLLPESGGAIRPMSGGGGGIPGGFNPGVSLLPDGPGQIGSYSGGFVEEMEQFGGVETRYGTRLGFPSGTSTTSTLPKVKILKMTPDMLATGTTPGGTPVATGTTPGGTPVATGATGATGTTEATGATGTTVATLAPVATGTTTALVENDKNSKTKDIVLFGTSLTLENPKKMTTDVFSENQNTALKLFGLDGPGLSDIQKKSVLQALYDGKCNSDKPLIMLQNCEPIRQIVQSLALNLLEKLQTTNNSDLADIKKEDKPIVEYTKSDDGGMKICISFKSGQLGLLSKFAPKANKKNSSVAPSPTDSSDALTTGSSSVPSPTSSSDAPSIKPELTKGEVGHNSIIVNG